MEQRFPEEIQRIAIEQFTEGVTELAEKAMKQLGEIIPTVFLMQPREAEKGEKPAFNIYVIPVPFGSPNEKDKYAQLVKQCAADVGNIIAGILMSEAWVSTQKIDESDPKSFSPKMAPSEDPNRREVIIVSMRSENFSRCRVIPFTKTSDTVIFGEPEQLDDLVSNFDRFFGDLFDTKVTRVLH